ncbi:MAG: heavy-metal-associated domain-containing protein [Pseudomonadota bacterium]
MKTEIFKIPELQDKENAFVLARVLQPMKGVSQVSASLAQQRLTVLFDSTIISSAELREAMSGAGFNAAPAPAGGCCGGCCG